MPESTKIVSLKEVMQVFLKLGLTGFGGPVAHIAMMREEVVEKRNWLSEKDFFDLVGATHLIPGPNSTELAIHIGHQKGGRLGLLVAGLSFILPAFLAVLLLAVTYVKFGALKELEWILMGMRPVIIAIVVQALWKFHSSAVTNTKTTILAVISIILAVLGFNEVLIILSLGLGLSLFSTVGNKKWSIAPALILGSAPIPFISSSSIFWFFLKIGSVLFGSGYVLLAFIQDELVEKRMWLTETQLLDAITVGQVTPGPVFTTATFIGYLLQGYSGAILATIGIFLPSFFFVALSAPFLPKLRASAFWSYFLDGVNAASFGLMALVTFELGSKSFINLWCTIVGVVSLIVLIKFKKLNTLYLIITGGLIGFLTSLT